MIKRKSLEAPEAFVLRLTLAVAGLCLVLVSVRGAVVDLQAYSLGIGGAMILFIAGLGYRISGRDARIGATLVCASLFILFTISLSLFNYLLLPHWSPTIDGALARIDEAMFGYRWPDLVAWSAGHPLLNETMRYAYLSTLPQIAVLLALLGLSGRTQAMYGLMVSIAVAGLATVCFWGFFPSLGPSAIFDLPSDILAAADPVVGPDYGQTILDLFARGAPVLSPDEIRGLIAFPSFHVVLALAAVYYSRDVAWAFPVYLAINLFVMPGVLVHGGHHVVDIPAGAVTFAASAFLAARMHKSVEQPAQAEFGAVPAERSAETLAT